VHACGADAVMIGSLPEPKKHQDGLSLGHGDAQSSLASWHSESRWHHGHVSRFSGDQRNSMMALITFGSPKTSMVPLGKDIEGDA